MSGYAFHPADGVLECHSAEGNRGSRRHETVTP